MLMSVSSIHLNPLSSPPHSPGFISNLTIQRQHFPNDDDQTGAAKALMRLQDTYKLDTHTISTGELPGEAGRHTHTHTHPQRTDEVCKV